MKTASFPKKHPGQIRVLSERRRFNWLSAGRRWRKTSLLATIGAREGLLGKRILWGAPTYKQLLLGWRELYWMLHEVADFKKADQEVLLPTGGIIFCRSLELPDNARGITADGVCLDEAGYIQEDAYYQVVRQMLMDTQGWLWAGGTPCGRNWFWREHQSSRDDPSSMAWQIPTVGCDIVDDRVIRIPHPYENPFIPFEEIDHLFKTTPRELFEQEVLAQFIQGGGSVFTNIAPNLYEGESIEAHQGHMLILTIDWAKHKDWTVLDLGCGDCKRELLLDRFNKIDYITQRDRIKTLVDQWKPELVVAEKNSIGEPNIELLCDEGMPIQAFDMTPSSKPGLIRRLATALQRGEWKFLNDKTALFELEAFEQKTTPSGYTQYRAPDGAHDDTVIARALLVHAEANMGHVPLIVQ